VRSAPVHPAAAPAARECLISAPGPRPQQRLHLGLGDRAEQAIARSAPGPGRQRHGKPVQHVGELVVRAGAAHKGAKPERTAAQQCTVLGQQHSLPGVGLFDQRVVIQGGLVVSVNAGQPQPPRECPQVDIQQEASHRQRLRPSYRIDLRHVPAGEPAAGRDHGAVDRKAADFGQRHPPRLHDVSQR
jgi:hypothetical protein